MPARSVGVERGAARGVSAAIGRAPWGSRRQRAAGGGGRGSPGARALPSLPFPRRFPGPPAPERRARSRVPIGAWRIGVVCLYEKDALHLIVILLLAGVGATCEWFWPLRPARTLLLNYKVSV